MATVRTVDFTQMLGHFQHEPVSVVVRFQRVHDLGQFAFELHVDDGAHDLGHAADLVAHLFVHGAVLFHFAFDRGGLDGDAPWMPFFINPLCRSSLDDHGSG